MNQTEFIKRMAGFSLPEEECGKMDVDEWLADLSDDRLCDEYSAFMDMVRAARELVSDPAHEMQLSLDEVYVIPREMTDEEWSEVKYNVDRKANPDIDLWRIKEAVKYANFIAGHRGRKILQTPSPQTRGAGSVLDALLRAESFMAGFEGDDMQEGIDADLKVVRDAIASVEVGQ